MTKPLVKAIVIIIVALMLFHTQNVEGLAVIPDPQQTMAENQRSNLTELETNSIQEEISAAVEEALNHSTSLFAIIFDIQIENILMYENYAMIVLNLFDPMTGEIIQTEAEYAFAINNDNQWEVFLPDHTEWNAIVEAIPVALISQDHKHQIMVYDPETREDRAYSGYYLPWEGGRTRTLSRSISHGAGDSYYAFDFYDAGDRYFNVTAARPGVIWYARWNVPRDGGGCDTSEQRNYVNYVVVKNDLGLYDLYLHLDYNSIPSHLRTKGNTVKRGEKIANADNTGCSTGSHLHFMAHTTSTSWWGKSVDIRFTDVSVCDGRPRTTAEASCGRSTYTSGNYYDNTAPTNPTTINPGCTASSNVWQNTCNKPSFTWSGATDSGSGVDGYQYYWGTSSTGTSTSYTTSTSYSPAAVGSGTYYFRLRTKDKAGNYAAWKTMFILKFDGTAPANPTSISPGCNITSNVWQNVCNQPSFTWSGDSDGHSGVAGFQYYWGTSSSGTSTTYTTTRSYSPSAVSIGTYYFRLRTKDTVGNYSAWSTLFTLRFDNSPPFNPISVSESQCGAVSNFPTTQCNSPSFSWSVGSDDSSGVNGYEIYFGLDPYGSSPNLYTVNLFYEPGALADGFYYLRLRTKDNAGNYSNWDTLFLFDLFFTIPILLDPHAKDLDTLVPVFEWEINDSLHPYTFIYIYLSTDENFPPDKTISMWEWADKGSTKSRMNLQDDTTYYWYAAYDYPFYDGWIIGRNSPYKHFSTGSLSQGEILDAPTLVFPVDVVIKDEEIQLQWEVVPGAAYYEGYALYPWYFDEYWNDWVYGGYYINTVANNFLIDTLIPNTEYLWYVRAVNDFAYGQQSDIAYFTTSPGNVVYMPLVFIQKSSTSSLAGPDGYDLGSFETDDINNFNDMPLFIISAEGDLLPYKNTK